MTAQSPDAADPQLGTVLVVDDDVTICDVLRRYLESAGHRVLLAGDGRRALELAGAESPDLIVLDLMLPGMDGMEVCRRLREYSAVPVIMLTALGQEEHRITGLALGADDYVTKPFSPRELALRVQSVLRRSRAPQPEPLSGQLRDGDLVLDRAARTATRDGRALNLTVREYDLLAYLLAHPRVAYSRADLLERVWGWDFGDQTTVTVHVRRLREKVEDDPANPSRIVTVRGMGYRYEPADEP